VIAGLSPVETLQADHDTSAFDRGRPALNDWLKRFARQNQATGAVRSYVVHRGSHVVGYYALAAGSVERKETPSRIYQGLARHPVPVVIVARLVVDREEHGNGLGKALLTDALSRIAGAADVIGVRAVLVHAKDKEARSFYDRFDFEPSPVDPMRLFLLMKDLRRAAGRD
jgi:GNAT superfamily N-acetyltransferase